jgi:hypothetical protein
MGRREYFWQEWRQRVGTQVGSRLAIFNRLICLKTDTDDCQTYWSLGQALVRLAEWSIR